MTEQSSKPVKFETFQLVGRLEGDPFVTEPGFPSYGIKPRARSHSIEMTVTDVNEDTLKLIFGEPVMWSLEKLTRWQRFRRWLKRQ